MINIYYVPDAYNFTKLLVSSQLEAVLIKLAREGILEPVLSIILTMSLAFYME